jgi:hypothetical protein
VTRVGKLTDQLRKKYRSPREALRALGLDEQLLDVQRLALDGATMRPNRLQFLAITRAAAVLNPQLAMDAKVDYGPIFKGLTSANIKQRKPTILSDVKKALKGKTIAKDASIESLAHMLDQFEHVKEPKSLDESVSAEQHKAMEAAAHGASNLGIPKDVGKEFAEADKGKTFDAEPIKALLREKGMSEDDIEAVAGMLPKPATDEAVEEEEVEEATDEDPMEALDEEDDEEKKRKEAADRAAKDRAAKDKKGMDKKMVTADAMNAAIKAAVQQERENSRQTAEAREFVRPWVGELSMGLDSAEKVLRSAANTLGIKNAEKINIEGLRTIIELQPRAGAQSVGGNDDLLAQDGDTEVGGGHSDFNKRFPGAARIGTA